MQNINNFCPIAPKHFSSPVLESYRRRSSPSDTNNYYNICTDPNGKNGYLVQGIRANPSDTGITDVRACVKTDETNFNRLTSIYSYVDNSNNKRSVCTSLNSSGKCNSDATNYKGDAVLRKGSDTFWVLFADASNNPFSIDGIRKESSSSSCTLGYRPNYVCPRGYDTLQCNSGEYAQCCNNDGSCTDQIVDTDG
jgi:hypothetical protein